MAENTVQFNVKNAHYATKTASGWGTPVALPGLVSVTVEPVGDKTQFYADGIEYYTCENNNGYDGEIELAHIVDTFRTDVLGETSDSNDVLVENSTAEMVKFALSFDIVGNNETVSYWFYNCTASRPKTEAKTSEATKEVATETLSFSCRPDSTGKVRAKTTAETDSTTKSGWHSTVYTGA